MNSNQLHHIHMSNMATNGQFNGSSPSSSDNNDLTLEMSSAADLFARDSSDKLNCASMKSSDEAEQAKQAAKTHDDKLIMKEDRDEYESQDYLKRHKKMSTASNEVELNCLTTSSTITSSPANTYNNHMNDYYSSSNTSSITGMTIASSQGYDNLHGNYMMTSHSTNMGAGSVSSNSSSPPSTLSSPLQNNNLHQSHQLMGGNMVTPMMTSSNGQSSVYQYQPIMDQSSQYSFMANTTSHSNNLMLDDLNLNRSTTNMSIMSSNNEPKCQLGMDSRNSMSQMRSGNKAKIDPIAEYDMQLAESIEYELGLKKQNGPRKNSWGNLSYAELITKAIESSCEQRLTLSQIYDWIIKYVPYFKEKHDRTSSAGWKNSIRHNLSLHNRFIRVQNESSGKSSWWMINPDVSKYTSSVIKSSSDSPLNGLDSSSPPPSTLLSRSPITQNHKMDSCLTSNGSLLTNINTNGCSIDLTPSSSSSSSSSSTSSSSSSSSTSAKSNNLSAFKSKNASKRSSSQSNGQKMTMSTPSSMTNAKNAKTVSSAVNRGQKSKPLLNSNLNNKYPKLSNQSMNGLSNSNGMSQSSNKLTIKKSTFDMNYDGQTLYQTSSSNSNLLTSNANNNNNNNNLLIKTNLANDNGLQRAKNPELVINPVPSNSSSFCKNGSQQILIDSPVSISSASSSSTSPPSFTYGPTSNGSILRTALQKQPQNGMIGTSSTPPTPTATPNGLSYTNGQGMQQHSPLLNQIGYSNGQMPQQQQQQQQQGSFNGNMYGAQMNRFTYNTNQTSLGSFTDNSNQCFYSSGVNNQYQFMNQTPTPNTQQSFFQNDTKAYMNSNSGSNLNSMGGANKPELANSGSMIYTTMTASSDDKSKLNQMSHGTSFSYSNQMPTTPTVTSPTTPNGYYSNQFYNTQNKSMVNNGLLTSSSSTPSTPITPSSGMQTITSPTYYDLNRGTANSSTNLTNMCHGNTQSYTSSQMMTQQSNMGSLNFNIDEFGFQDLLNTGHQNGGPDSGLVDNLVNTKSMTAMTTPISCYYN